MKMTMIPTRSFTSSSLAIILCTILTIPTLTKAGEARYRVLGPGGLAVLNSTYRPVIPYHVNGLVDDAKIGADFETSFGSQETVEDRKVASLENSYIAYALIPLFRMAKKNRPSGISVKIRSRGANELRRHRYFAREQVVEIEELAVDVGFILAPARDWMVSTNLSVNHANVWRRDVLKTKIEDLEYQRVAKIREVETNINAEIGYRLRLTEESSIAMVYRPKLHAKNGKIRSEKIVGLGGVSKEKTKHPSRDPGLVSFGFKTRATKDATIGIGVRNSFRSDRDLPDRNLKEVVPPVSVLSFAGETRHLEKTRIWLPRFGLDFSSDNTFKLSLGASVQNEIWAFDGGLLLSSRSHESLSSQKVILLMGLSYRVEPASEKI